MLAIVVVADVTAVVVIVVAVALVVVVADVTAVVAVALVVVQALLPAAESPLSVLLLCLFLQNTGCPKSRFTH